MEKCNVSFDTFRLPLFCRSKYFFFFLLTFAGKRWKAIIIARGGCKKKKKKQQTEHDNNDIPFCVCPFNLPPVHFVGAHDIITWYDVGIICRWCVATCNPLCNGIGRTQNNRPVYYSNIVVRYHFGQDDVRHEVGKSINNFYSSSNNWLSQSRSSCTRVYCVRLWNRHNLPLRINNIIARARAAQCVQYIV